MNQARKRTGTKKVLSMILVLVMLLSLLSMAAFTLPTAASSDGAASTLNNRIVHLDCGRKYFSVTYIKGVIDSMAENGFNQLELAFGNGGLRFVLDDMTIKNGSTTLFDSDAVKAAVLEGNNNFYDDPNGNALTENDMKAIISYAENKGVEIVPLLNMPGHMDGLLSSSLFSQYKLSGSEGSLNLNNANAVTFGKALLKLYVDWFKQNANLTSHFNFGSDEYGQGIRNPYIESGVAKVTYNQLINYMNDCADVIETESMTARCFNDFVCYNRRTSCNLSKTVEVCYWSNQWNGSEYNTPDVIKNAGYKLINTNQKWYFVPSKAEEYGKSVVESNLANFDVTKFQNIKSGWNSTSTTYTQIPVGNSNVGAMFCVWSDTPSVDVPLKDVQDLIAAMATANSAYFTKKPTETQNTFSVTASSGSGSEADTATLTVNGTTTLTATAEATWTSSNEAVVKLSAAQTASAAKAATVSTAITSTAVTATAVGAGTATITATSTADPSKTAQITLTVAAGDSALSKVTLPINLWLTNTGVVPTGWGTTYSSISKSGFDYKTDITNTYDYWRTFRATYNLSAAESNVNSEQGAKLSDLLPGTGTAYGYRGDSTPESYPVDFWKCSYNTSAERQSTDGWTNKSLNGTEFQYIRYWNENWAYSTDGADWVTISNVGAGANDTGKNQVNIWYRQVTTVTDEITTLNVDWGPAGTPTTDTQNQILDYAVKYESGQMSPSTFPNDGKSVVYNMGGDNTYSDTDTTGNYRIVYGITGLETADYELYMITLTPNPDKRTTGWWSSEVKKYTYKSENEKAIWVKSQADLPSDITPFSNDAFYGNCVYGGEPTVDRAKIYEGRSLLVTYYVRAKQTDDSLTVHYIDATDENNQTEFYSYNIAVAGGTVFDKNIGLPEIKINNNVTSLTNGKVINKYGNTQYVSSNLAQMPAIGAEYRYVQYKCYNVVRTDDKNVYLYYTFSNKVSYVIDFGLPLKIKLSDLNASLNGATIQTVKIDGAKFGKTDYANGVITYTPTKAINEIDALTVTVTGYITYKDADGKDVTKNGTVSYKVSIIPATSVYYEDSFAQFTNGTGKASAAKWTTDKDGTDPKATTTQALSALGSKDVYGHDAAYADSTKLSMGSARKVTVSAGMVKDWTENSAWPTATFTFKGTGFDIISLTDNTSGNIFVTVTNKATGQIEKRTTVNNYYGYKLDDGKWVTSPNDPNCLYQIPVIKVAGLDYAEYEVKIQVAYADFLDEAKAGKYSFWLDAIRVYDPMGKDNATYAQDDEGYPQYIKLRDALVGNTAQSQAVFIDGGAEANVDTYKNLGPNNEIYLANGQAITFTVPKNDKIASIQIGAKAPNGSAAKMVVNNGEAKDIQSATEMYYKIGTAGDSFTITNTGTGILSLTNLKITFKDKPGSAIALSAPTAEEQNDAVMSVRALFAAPEQTFEPEHFTAKWSRNVRKGGTATLTVKASADVAAITVNGEEITVYTTKTARSFWGSKETYHVFTYRVTNAATADYSICALNAKGAVSDPITAQLTVRPSIRDWWNGIFDKWKH